MRQNADLHVYGYNVFTCCHLSRTAKRSYCVRNNIKMIFVRVDVWIVSNWMRCHFVLNSLSSQEALCSIWAVNHHVFVFSLLAPSSVQTLSGHQPCSHQEAQLPSGQTVTCCTNRQKEPKGMLCLLKFFPHVSVFPCVPVSSQVLLLCRPFTRGGVIKVLQAASGCSFVVLMQLNSEHYHDTGSKLQTMKARFFYHALLN